MFKQFSQGDRVFTPEGRGTVQDSEFVQSRGTTIVYVSLDSKPQNDEKEYTSSQLKRDK